MSSLRRSLLAPRLRLPEAGARGSERPATWTELVFGGHLGTVALMGIAAGAVAAGTTAEAVAGEREGV